MAESTETSTTTRMDELIDSWREFAHQPLAGGQREQLIGFLDFQRATVLLKCRGLTDEQARRPLVASELTTVAGVLSHLRWVEAHWFARLSGDPVDLPYDEADPDGDFVLGKRTSLAQLLAEYVAEVEHSNEVVAGLDLEHRVPFRDKGELNVRWVLIHMIEETARHVGHLDLLREHLDGETGE